MVGSTLGVSETVLQHFLSLHGAKRISLVLSFFTTTIE